jgi:hypothetical protein
MLINDTSLINNSIKPTKMKINNTSLIKNDKRIMLANDKTYDVKIIKWKEREAHLCLQGAVPQYKV